MPWTAQGSKNEVFVSQEPAVSLWGEQGSRNEVYIKNERLVLDARVYSNGGEQIFALDGSPVMALFAIEALWVSQVEEREGWV